MTRPRPAPKPSSRVARRNRRIVQLVVEEGIPQIKVARRFRLTPTTVCQIVRQAQGLRSARKPQSKRMLRKTPEPSQGPRVTTKPWDELTRAQWTARERYIEQRVSLGASLRAVARRYGITVAKVAGIVEDVRRRRGGQ
jgi:transposase-like protein